MSRILIINTVIYTGLNFQCLVFRNHMQIRMYRTLLSVTIHGTQDTSSLEHLDTSVLYDTLTVFLSPELVVQCGIL